MWRFKFVKLITNEEILNAIRKALLLAQAPDYLNKNELSSN